MVSLSMTPDQLKDYVDGVLKHRDSLMLLYFLAVPILSFLAAFIGAYLREKGKNVATREDIADITRKVENIKQEFTMGLERLKADLDRTTHVSKQQFDVEFAIYRDICEKLVTMRQRFFELNPYVSELLSTQAAQERQQRRIEAFNSAYGEFIQAVDRNQPFYSDEVYTALSAIIEVCIDEKIESALPPQPNYWKRVSNNKQKLLKSIDGACKSIRARFQHLLSSSGFA
jgi:hypothetical protein